MRRRGFTTRRSGGSSNEDPFAGVADTPPSLHRFLYAFGNPTVYWDPDGRESLKQVVQDYAADAYSDGNWFEKGIAFLGQAAYAVAEAASVGAVGRIDSAQEQLDRGEITKDQYWNQTGKAVVKSGAIIAVGAATGGAGALVARGAGAGATATAVISGTAAGLGSQAGGDLVEGELSSVQDYALSGGLGAAGGLAVRGVQALKASGVGDMTVGQATKSVVSKLKSAVLGESASTSGAAVAEVTVTQSVSANTAADDIWDQLVRNAGDPGDAASAAIRSSARSRKECARRHWGEHDASEVVFSGHRWSNS